MICDRLTTEVLHPFRLYCCCRLLEKFNCYISFVALIGIIIWPIKISTICRNSVPEQVKAYDRESELQQTRVQLETGCQNTDDEVVVLSHRRKQHSLWSHAYDIDSYCFCHLEHQHLCNALPNINSESQ